MSKKLEAGQRVYCEFPKSLVRKIESNAYEGTIVKQGYRSDQWIVRPDYTPSAEMVHESFITPIEANHGK